MPFSAASRENGAAALVREGGSMRAVRRRVERIPVRFGERPAGAERGEDLVMPLSFFAWDLGWMVRLGLAGREGFRNEDASGFLVVRT